MATPLSLVFSILAIDNASAVFQRVGASATLAGAESERGMVRVGGAIAGIARGLTLAGAAAAVVSVKMAADFQSAMLKIQTQAGASAAEVNKMSGAVLKLAGEVGIAPTKLAESLYHIESVNIRGGKAIDVLRFAAEGAKVSGADLEETTNALTAAVASGMKGTEDYGAAMGKLNGIVGIGDMKMSDLNAAMSTGILVTMKQYGVTLDDVGAALATFGDNNIRGQDAATNLRMAVQGFFKVAPAGEKLLSGIGLSAKQLQDDIGKHGLTYVIDELHQHMTDAGVAGDKAGGFITAAFGKRAGAGLLVLNGEVDRLNTKLGQMQGLTGDQFAKAWEATQQNFKVQLERMKATVEAFAISMGTKLLPAVTSVFKYLADHKQILADIAYAIGTTLVVAVGLFTISLLTNPVVIFGTAIAGVGIAAVDAYKNFKPFRDMVDGFVSNVADKFDAARTAVSKFYDGLTGKSSVTPVAAGTPKRAAENDVGGTSGAASAGQSVAAFFKNDIIPALLDFWHILHDKVIPAVGGFIDKIRAAVEKYGPPLAHLLKDILVPGFQAFGDYLTKSLFPTMKTLGEVFGPIIMPIIGALVAAVSIVLATAFTTVAELLKHVVGPAIVILGGFFVKLAAIIGQVADGILVTIKFLGDGILSGVSSILRAMGMIDPAFRGAADKVDGWKTSFDGNMHDAIASTNNFVDSANAKLDELLHPRTIKIDAVLAAEVAGSTSLASKFSTTLKATGGAIYGPGSGTSDSIPAWLSNGEHVWTASEVSAAGGHAAVEGMRRAVKGFAAGGPVLAVNYPNPTPWAGFLSTSADAQARALLPQLMPQMMAAARAAQAASSGGAPGAAGGAARWAPQILQVLAMLGQPASLLAGVEALINKESGGNPNAQNNTDSNAKAGHPSKGLMQCVSLETTVLTERGWLTHDAVRVGDRTIGYNPRTGRSEWTTITKVVHYGDAPVWRVGHHGWHADVTPNHRWWSDTEVIRSPETATVCPECGYTGSVRGVSTHRGRMHKVRAARVVEHRGEFIRTEDFTSGHRVRLAAPAETTGVAGLSVEDAQILAWLQGDGHIAPAKEGGWDGTIYQAKPQMVSKLRALLAHVEHSESIREPRLSHHLPAHVFRLRRSYVTDLVKRAGSVLEDPEAFVLALSPDQRAGWLSAMIDAEGHRMPGKQPGWSEFVRITQVDGLLQDAIRLAVYLEGWRPTYSANSAERRGFQPCGTVGMAKPHVAPSTFHAPEVLANQTVWCVKTDLETWTAGLDGQVFLTGNTIIGTFLAYAGPFRDRGIFDPLANIYAGVNYALTKYGPGMLASGGRHDSSGGYVGYERGTGYVPVTGMALLHEGERVTPKNQNTRGGSGGTSVVHIYDVNNVLIGTMDGRIDAADAAHASVVFAS